MRNIKELWKRLFNTFEKGDMVIYTSPMGNLYRCKITKVSKGRVRAVCLEGEYKGLFAEDERRRFRHYDEFRSMVFNKKL